jgi:hypothetical protein
MRSSDIFRKPRTPRAIVRWVTTTQGASRYWVRKRVIGRLWRTQSGASVSARSPWWRVVWVMNDGCPGWTGHHPFVFANRARVRWRARFLAKVFRQNAATTVEAFVVCVKGGAGQGSLSAGELLRRHSFTKGRR